MNKLPLKCKAFVLKVASEHFVEDSHTCHFMTVVQMFAVRILQQNKEHVRLWHFSDDLFSEDFPFKKNCFEDLIFLSIVTAKIKYYLYLDTYHCEKLLY